MQSLCLNQILLSTNVLLLFYKDARRKEDTVLYLYPFKEQTLLILDLMMPSLCLHLGLFDGSFYENSKSTQGSRLREEDPDLYALYSLH